MTATAGVKCLQDRGINCQMGIAIWLHYPLLVIHHVYHNNAQHILWWVCHMTRHHATTPPCLLHQHCTACAQQFLLALSLSCCCGCSFIQGVAAAQAGVSVIQPNVGRTRDWYNKNPGIIRDPHVRPQQNTGTRGRSGEGTFSESLQAVPAKGTL